MSYKIFDEIKNELVADKDFSKHLINYVFGHDDITFHMKEEMTYYDLKEITDRLDIYQKYDVDCYIDGNEFKGLKINFFNTIPKTHG